MVRYTPGPWMVDLPENCGPNEDWGVWHQDSGGPICYVGDPYPRGDNHPYENMVLISAVPEMYTLLQIIQETAEETDAGYVIPAYIMTDLGALLVSIESKAS